jgi:hypothetical protein
MKNSQKNLLPFAILATFLLTACSHQVKQEQENTPIQSLDQETADLADVTADALAMANNVGNDQVLMVFDIDNTLLAMEQGLGADQWYEWQSALSKNDHCNPEYVGDRFAVQGALLFASAMRSTQLDTAVQVRQIQDKGIPVIVVTSRGHDYRLQTFRELRRNGYNFSYTAIGPIGGYEQPFMPLEGGRMSRYEDGVFMTAGQHKGQMLYSLLKKTGTSLPAVVLMADDKQKNLDAVKETFASLDVPVRAWRYTGEDANVAGFDADKANAEWQSIDEALRSIQRTLGPDNYDLSSAVPPSECQ